ncbi:unnamed protein product [Clonostachys rhizophaga]|uniref:Major facilitator superfamily (MFS) profile domain-containing protein n=1 Tax=Clonostachys rhizophaga TaxID=160324 RepID=A0A9N9W268_9HYPO|nr:unnamed protein product [Clonostachys rhizophaga]
MTDNTQPNRGRWWDRYNPAPDTEHIRNRNEREREILRILDSIGFNWPVFIAVSAGFLASSYTIFSSNIIVPALRYVYPSENKSDQYYFPHPSLTIDMVTIGTTTLGMLVFGHLADLLGRKRLYGLELIIIILGTVGMIQTSDGFSNGREHSLDLYAAIATWRGIQGLGIGAEASYPVSAVIASEFSSTETRGTLMAAMFGMQSLGRLLAYAVTLGAVKSIPDDRSDHRVAVDRIWRLVVGISAIPAFAAVGLRFTIPETPRYYTGIKKDLRRAVQAVERVGGRQNDLDQVHESIQPPRTWRREKKKSWYSNAFTYLFGKTQGWKILLGISLQWCLLDINFYGLGLDSPSTLNRLWLSSPPGANMTCPEVNITVPAPAYEYQTATLTLQNSIVTTLTKIAVSIPTATTTSSLMSEITVAATDLPAWNEDAGNLCATIHESLQDAAERALEVTSVASIVGSIAAVFIINRYKRRNLLAWTCGILCVLFFAAGIAVKYATETPANEASLVFFALTQFVFNLGPNTLTFIIAAESFPTLFRGTFHGVAAAMGKVGALIIRPIINAVTHGQVGKDKETLSSLLFVFCGIQLVMVGIALIPASMVDAQVEDEETSLEWAERKRWLWLLFGRLYNKSLEEIAPNPESSPERRDVEMVQIKTDRGGRVRDRDPDVPPLVV